MFLKSLVSFFRFFFFFSCHPNSFTYPTNLKTLKTNKLDCQLPKKFSPKQILLSSILKINLSSTSIFVDLVVLCQIILISYVAKRMKGKWVTFNPLDKTPFADFQKSCIINVLVSFRSVTVARINTCCYIGVVNVQGNRVKYIDEQEISVNISAAQRQKANNSRSIEQRKCSSTEKTLKATYYQSKWSCKHSKNDWLQICRWPETYLEQVKHRQ